MRRSPGLQILLDVREASTPSLGPTEIYNLVMILRNSGLGPENRVAILYRPRDEVNRAQLFAMCANAQGFRVSAFRDFEEALDWLNGTTGLEPRAPTPDGTVETSPSSKQNFPDPS